jgi:hypothetical protein
MSPSVVFLCSLQLLDITHQAGVTGGLGELNNLQDGACGWHFIKDQILSSNKLNTYGGSERQSARATLWENGRLGLDKLTDRKYFSVSPCIEAGTETLNVASVDPTGKCILLKEPTQTIPYQTKTACNRPC